MKNRSINSPRKRTMTLTYSLIGIAMLVEKEVQDFENAMKMR